MEREQVLDILQALEEFIDHENPKHYWMVRTDDGRNYREFAEQDFIALNLRNFPNNFLVPIQGIHPIENRAQAIREGLIHLNDQHIVDLQFAEKANSFGRLANQIYTMCFGIQRGDIVMIPDRGAEHLKIGRVIDESYTFDDRINYRYSFSRHVEWIKEINKNRLDPYLYKALGAHQAICDITRYADIIERNYNSYFVVDNKFQYYLTVNSDNVSAWHLTSLINEILKVTKEFSDTYDLGINIEEIDLTININSPGKFGFCTTARNAAIIMAIAASLSGGSIQYNDFNISTQGVFHSLTESILEWKRGNQQILQNQAIFDRYLRSLDVQSVENWNNAVDANIDNINE